MHQDNPESAKVTKWFAAGRAFLAEVKQEMKNISWPAWQELRSTTLTIVLFLSAMAVYVYVVDRICLRLIDQLLLRHR